MDALLQQLHDAKAVLADREREYDHAHAAERAAAKRRDEAGAAVMAAEQAIAEATAVDQAA